MDDLDDDRDLDERREIEGDEEIGPLLKRLRGEHSLRDVQRFTGASSSYLSLIERGERRPGVNLINKLAVLYGVDVNELLQRARRLGSGDPRDDEPLEVERAYRYVMADPVFRVGTRPDGPITLKTKRFIVEMYERYTGKKLLE